MAVLGSIEHSQKEVGPGRSTSSSCSVLLSLEMASLGSNGMANETRILAALLARAGRHKISGLIMETKAQFTANVMPAAQGKMAISPLVASNFLVGMSGNETPFGFALMPRWRRMIWRFRRHFFEARAGFELSELPDHTFDNAIWRLLFAQTLSPKDRDVLDCINFVGSRATTADLHRHVNAPFPLPIGLDTRGYDVAVFHDARPFVLAPQTARVIRYHDAIPLLHPDLLGDGQYTTMHYRLLKAAAKDGWFVCNSEATRKELMTFAPETANRSVVIPCAQNFSVQTVVSSGNIAEILVRRSSDLTIDPKSEKSDVARLQMTIDAWQGKPNYIVCVAALEPKKNIPGIIAAYEHLIAIMPDPPKLVLIGSYGWRFEDAVKAMHPHIRTGNLIHLQDVPTNELMLMMKMAKLCFFPSLAEGFGYPPIEALYAGTVSVVSNLPALRETMGSAAIYVDPTDPASMCEGLIALLDPATGAYKRNELLAHRNSVLSQYEPEVTSQRWNEFLSIVKPVRNRTQ